MISANIFKLLKIKYWGLGYESKLPPEFIVTQHAQKRLKARLEYPDRHRGAELTMEAWYQGKVPPETFDQNRHRNSHHKNYAYKYYSGYIWIYGLRWNEHLGVDQKFLVTIYNWKE